jgi:hypothetical protein
MTKFQATHRNIRIKPQLTGLTKKIDILAEYVACGFTVKEASERMGLTYDYANAVWQRIKKTVGDRAI